MPPNSLRYNVVPPTAKIIEDMIANAGIQHVNSVLFKCLLPIKLAVASIVSGSIYRCPEYASIMAGELYPQMGNVDPSVVLQSVMDNVSGGVAVTTTGARRLGRGYSGSITIEILRSDYSEVLGVQGGSFSSEGGYSIDWIRWLTIEGDRILVYGYKFTTLPWVGSRTQKGFMRKASGGTWSVPPQYSGIASDNWLTRAILSSIGDIETAVGQELSRFS